MAEPLESLTFKVIVLKVSNHCKGCMKKVCKIIRNTEGVLETNIEPQQHKVTVKAIASVDANVIISRLAKYGKPAELWPQPKPSLPKIDSNTKPENTEAKKSTENSKPKQPAENSEKKSPPLEANTDKKPDDSKKETPAQKSPAEPPSQKPEKAEAIAEKEASKEPSKLDEKKTEPPPVEPEKPAAISTDETTAKTENKAPANDTGNENTKKTSSSTGKKSKGKELQEETSERAVPNHPNVVPMNDMYPYQQPSYVMSYNMSQPTASQSYYAYPMQREPQGYMYPQYPPPQSQEYYYGSMEGNSAPEMRQQYRSYDGMNMFNEEDPNSCSIM